MAVSAFAGPLTHARSALGAQSASDVLWAAFGRNVHYDVPGLYPDGRPKPNIALRIAGEVLAALPDTGPGADPGRPDPDVVVHGPADATAMRHLLTAKAAVPPGETPGLGPYLWALTARGLHVGRRVDQDGAAPGFLRGLADVFTSSGRPHVTVRPVRWLHEIPRDQVAGFSVTGRSGRSCLRLAFPDGSGFDFLFLAHNWPAVPDGPEQYQRLLALSLGRTDPWT